MVARGERGTGVWKKLCWGSPVPLGVVIRGWTKDNVQLVFNLKFADIENSKPEHLKPKLSAWQDTQAAPVFFAVVCVNRPVKNTC